MVKFYALLFFLVSAFSLVNAQAPDINYPAPQPYTVGAPITMPLKPVKSGSPLSSPAYTAYPPPVIAYAGPLNSTAGIAISALIPSNTGGIVPATVYGQVTTIAGSGTPANVDGIGTAASFSDAAGIVIDVSGNIFVADRQANIIRKITSSGMVSTFAGSGNYSSIDGTGTAASFEYPAYLAIDAAGNLYVAESNAFKIRKISPAGVVTTLAGSGHPGSSDGTGTAASFYVPQSVAADAAGNVYVADKFNNRIRKITPLGVVSTLAGSSQGATNGTGAAATFNQPYGIAVDNSGYIYVTDLGNNMIRKISPAGVVTTLAGSITAGSSNGIGTAARFRSPTGITVDNAGNVYVADQYNNIIRQINSSGVVTTLAGSGPAASQDGIGTLAGFTAPEGLATDNNGSIYLADSRNYKIRKIIVTGYSITPELPSGLIFDYSSGVISGSPASSFPTVTYKIAAYNTGGSSTASLNISVAAGAAPKIAYSGAQTYTPGTAIAPLSPVNTGGPVLSGLYLQNSFLAGGSSTPGANGTGAEANFNQAAPAIDASGNIYIADTYNNMIRKITPAGVTTTVAGSGQPGASDGTGAAATFNIPNGLAVDAAGNIYVADRGNFLIRRITHAGVVTTFAGNGTPTEVDGSGTGAGFHNPLGVVIDKLGNIFVLDGADIRKIAPDGTVTTFVTGAFVGPSSFSIDGSGNIYVADRSGSLIKKVTPAGIITTIGNSSTFTLLYGITVDKAGNIYVSDQTPAFSPIPRISRINPSGTVTPIALNFGGSLAIDKSGNLYASAIHGNIINKIITSNYFTISPSLPAGLIFNELTGVITGTPAAASAAKNYTITAYNSSGSGSATVNIKIVANSIATLSNLTLSSGALSPIFGSGHASYTASVGNAVSSITITPTTTEANATVKVNGTTVVSGTASASIPLSVGHNTITTIVTAQDGTTTKTYIITVTRAPSNIATLAGLTLSSGTLSPAFGSGHASYTASVGNAISSITLTPATTDANATVKVNGATVASGTASGSLPLAVGHNTITTVVTAQDGTTTKTYTITLTRAPSNIATLAGLTLSSGTLSPVFGSGHTSYTVSVSNATASITLTPTTTDATATIKVNGTTVISGTASASLPLAVGHNTITTVVTAQDGTTTKTYTLTVTRTASGGLADNDFKTSFTDQQTDGVVVHQGLSPNGDGMNEGLTIEGINNYPENKLLIMSRNGVLVYEVKGYDNRSRRFDGHSNKNGKLQQPGTYFYSLAYKVNGVVKYKTGFIILKW